MNQIVKKNYVETLNKYEEYFINKKDYINLDEIKSSILGKKRKRNIRRSKKYS